jgi:hypothetical protein
MWTIDVMSTYTYKIDINHAVKSQDTFIYIWAIAIFGQALFQVRSLSCIT